AAGVYTLSLHDALPICRTVGRPLRLRRRVGARGVQGNEGPPKERRGLQVLLPSVEFVLVERIALVVAHIAPHQRFGHAPQALGRSEEHTSELQSRENLV